MDKKTYYITTPIYYPSDKLHIGHAYCTVAADAQARFRRMQGYDVMFLTGTDEHGQKIEEYANKAGKSPKQYVDEIVTTIKALWETLEITNDKFIRTTDDYHMATVQKIFKALYDKGDIYKDEYEGMYCTPCESFWTEAQLVEGNCPDCNRPVKQAKEESYFFRLSKYQDRLEKLYEEQPDFISPKSRLNEMLTNFIKPGLKDLCVSRTSFKWGIPVSFDDKHVVYVWVDALSNYITALGYLQEDDTAYNKYWPAQVHLVGKEIVRFHSIIWPAMLMALDLPLPQMIFGHGWLLLEGGKMSKSKGNVVDPVKLCERYGTDAIRYFLLREVPFGSDGVFSNEALIARINSDLANDLGNLVSRTMQMSQKTFDGALKAVGAVGEFDEELKDFAKNTVESYTKHMESLLYSNAYTEVFRMISRANKYIDETKPWTLKAEEEKPRLAEILANLCEILRLAAIMCMPAMPTASGKILDAIGATGELREFSSLEFGRMREFTTKRIEILFPRIDMEKELAALEAEAIANEEAQKPKEPEITIDDFAKINFRVATVETCEVVPKSDKLYKLTVRIGEEVRTIASSIREDYKPEELVGRNVIVVSNLKKAKIRGIESHGMLLAADNADGSANVIFADQCENGSKVR